MERKTFQLDEIDRRILKILQEDCRTPLEQIANKLGAPKSTIHYRIKRLEEEGIINAYYAKVNPEKIGHDFLTITFIRAKFSSGYHERVGRDLAKIPGVWGVYYVFGENDFIVLTRSRDREDYFRKLEKIMNIAEVERTNTQVVAKIMKEDFRVEVL